MIDTDYATFFERTAGFEPHGYQRRVAERDELPALIEVPPGYGKTAAIVLAWLWRRRFHPDQAVRRATPRRLIYALPQRALADQVASEIAKWLAAVDLSDEVPLHVVMGGAKEANRPWRGAPEADSIFVGTVDIIVSKALVRGYGVPRNAFPIDAALVWNDAHVVIDEVQGAPASTVTLRQVEAFRAEQSDGVNRLTCMSATVPHESLDTVDNPYPDEESIVRIGPDDVTDDLRRRRAALRHVREVTTERADPRSIAKHVLDRHRPGRLTLVIVNTVKSAREIETALRRLNGPEPVLLHSQFRPVDRRPRITLLAQDPPPEGRIVVATQVVEAGIDVDADVVITEAAPWSSLVQRSGRCNRRGLTDDAELWWIRPIKAAPYDYFDTAATEKALAELEDQYVTNEQLLQTGVVPRPFTPLTLRRSDFFALFDTSPDLSGYDLDIAPYVRDIEELSVQLCWADWAGSTPPEKLKLPPPDHRCRVPVPAVTDLVRAGRPVWRFDPVRGGWQTIDSQHRARPGEVLVLNAADGGYRTERGFDPTCKERVPTEQNIPAGGDEGTLSEDDVTADPRSFVGQWVALDQHLGDTAEEAKRLVADLTLSEVEATDVVLAARVHDIGKAHPTWQDALVRTADAGEADAVKAGRPWAKSAGQRGRLSFGDGIRSFRHELASLLLLDGPLRGLLRQAHDPDLVRYLVLAHHGKLRVQLRETHPGPAGTYLGLVDGASHEIPSVLGIPQTRLQTSTAWLSVHSSDQQPSWSDVAAALIERHGVFRLAYLETLVRIADWRASARYDNRQEQS